MHAAMRPIGYFIHHQGRGHALRAAALIEALPAARPVTIFCARPDILPPLRPGVTIREIPSLFEPDGSAPAGMGGVETPETLHCAPLGWRSIREAMGEIAGWMASADPALLITDVSAEIAQLARICSVPHVAVLQHGDRGDPGHRAAYQGAAGILAPFHEALAQTDWDTAMRAKIHFAPGLGDATAMPERDAARRRLGRGERPLALIVSGGGGDGVTDAPLGVGARAMPGWDWISIGEVRRDWHATPPANLRHLGWVDDAADWIAAADMVIASTGNSTCQQVLTAGRPWIAVPEWRYFDEQVEKARALARAGVAHHLPAMPSSAHAWTAAFRDALAGHDPARQRALVSDDAAPEAARWIESLIDRLWSDAPAAPIRESEAMPHRSVSALTIARGRGEHLANVVRGLAMQTTPPDEFVVAAMQPDPYDLPEAPFPIRQVHVAGDELPLAAARNAAAAAASGDLLVFLDVDCVPHPDLVADYLTATAEVDGLVMGEVLYLPGGAVEEGPDFARFDRLAVRHSDRRGPPAEGVEPCEDYRCFWSLNFAMSRGDWQASGGFDTAYVGYGGEDTDFGRSLAERSVPLWWTKGARAYHQYHPHAMPPVHHLRAVLRNAEVFASKWGHRTMEHWLHAFRLMGLIENRDGQLRILREPDERDFALCRQLSHQPYASTRRVLDLLQAAQGRDETERRAEVEREQSDMLGIAAE